MTLLLVLMAATVVLAPVAERMAIPYPVLLLMFGLVLAPLLFAAALGAAVAPPVTGAFSPWHGSTTLALAVAVGTDAPGREHHVGGHRIAGDGCGFRLRRPGAACRGQ